MTNTPEQPDYEIDDSDDEFVISTKEDLTYYLRENPEVVTTIIQSLGKYFVGEGRSAIEGILEKGYEDSFYISDFMNYDLELEAIVSTPYIEADTDWEQPFEENSFQGIPGFPKDVLIDYKLESDFGSTLLRKVLYLIEEKGKSSPSSSFVGIFGLKVLEAYKPLLAERLQDREQKRRAEREEDDGRLRQEREAEDRALEWVSEEDGLKLLGSESQTISAMWQEWLEEYRALRRVRNAVYEYATLNEVLPLGEWQLHSILEQVAVKGTLFRIQESLHREIGRIQGEPGTEFQQDIEAMSEVLQQMRDAWQELEHSDIKTFNDATDSGTIITEFLTQKRETEDKDLENEREEEDQEEIAELRLGTLSSAIAHAVSPIGGWIKETIEAEGNSLVFDALEML